MKAFVFNLNFQGESLKENNGWVFKTKVKRFGVFSLTTPIQKEITYTKGPVVRYLKHTVLGIGYTKSGCQFKGFAFFDLHIRIPVIMCILLGVGYAANNIYSGILWASLFYLLISFLSASDDATLMRRAKVFFLKQE